MEVTNPNKQLQRARQELNSKINVPDGYIEVKLSTKGKVGAPESFYVRNFSPEDHINLGLTDRKDVPIKMIKILDSLIWNPEKDPSLSVRNFHQKEVIELLLLIYETFYTTIFANQTWKPTEEDLAFIAATSEGGENGEEYRNKINALKNGGWKPTFDIDISALEFYEIPDDFKCKAKVDREYEGKTFSLAFTLPKFGDFIDVKYFVDSIFKEDDQRFARISDIYKFRKECEERMKRGENVTLASIPIIPKEELSLYKEYENEKTLFSITAAKALYICEFDGEDVSKLPLEQKLEMAKDPRLDYSTFKMIEDSFKNLKFGLKEDITVLDPIMNKVVTRKHTFRIVDLLSALRNTRTSKVNVSFI